MNKLSQTVYFTIHGHFYQPPRENPWTGRISLQPDAAPFHDWNDRILIQCYQPNAMARIVDAKGRIVEIVNNFHLLSFNIGPTLFEWLERNAPVVYHRIIEGDRQSALERSGHGNAIAQVYNHMILPLAREEEQRTQIRWAIYEFQKRFGRDPEGMWLPETAANPRTLEILMEEGIRFTILAPTQADKICRIGTQNWETLHEGSLDTTRAYRQFHSKDQNRWIDLIFFDKPLSTEISFGDFLFESKKLMEKLHTVPRPDRHHPEIIPIACDGETFGHHKAFGERVIAFVLHEEAERQGFKRTNFAEYLEKFPPQFEVKIKEGEGTSWSCSHGVGRWKTGCGCNTGAGQGWNQKWREPLRQGVIFLEQKLAELYEKQSGELFQNPSRARDAYIELILDRSGAARKKFFEKQAKHHLSSEEEIKAIKLLEMERFAMLTETSCGWFFNDISGIETIQILRYAARALELAREFGATDLEGQFAGYLRQAKSNRSDFGDGEKIWNMWVKPSKVTGEKIVSHFAFRKFFELPISQEDFYSYQIEEGRVDQEKAGDMTFLMGRVILTGKVIPQSQPFLYAIFQKGLSELYCFVKKETDADEFHRLNTAPLAHLREENAQVLAEHLEESFQCKPITLKDLFPEERDQILRLFSREMRQDYYKTAESFYEENKSWAHLFQQAGRPLPEEFRSLIEWMMGEKLIDGVKKLETGTDYEEVVKGAKAVIEEGRSGGFLVKTEPAAQYLSLRLNDWIERLFKGADIKSIDQIEKLLAFARELQIELQDRIAQELFFIFTQKKLCGWIEGYKKEPGAQSQLSLIQASLKLGDHLGFNMERYENLLRQKAEVR